MSFDSLEFLIFLPTVVCLFYAVRDSYRRWVLLFFSYFFYSSWNFKYLFLMIFSTVVTYLSAILIQDYEIKKKPFLKKLTLAICIVSNLSVLFVFKYYNFFVENINSLSPLLGFNQSISMLDVLLPVGISFYTFQSLSYSIDVYRQTVNVEKSLPNYALFVGFFPQLVAGPIERSSRLLPQIKTLSQTISLDKAQSALLLILWGLIKKLVIADRLAVFVNIVFNDPSEFNSTDHLIASIFFSFQIYCDFSSYSDIAVGCGRLFNINLMKNFDTPYLSRSISEFWQRWHISLGAWFRDYLYLPLGGNRVGIQKHLLNLLIVFVVSGLWHGASWNFIIWGLIHGFFVCGEVLYKKLNFFEFKLENSFAGQVFRVVLTFIVVLISWIFFRADNLNIATHIVKSILNFTNYNSSTLVELHNLKWIDLKLSFLFIGLIFCGEALNRYYGYSRKILTLGFLTKTCLIVTTFLVLVIFGMYGNTDTGQFIYFQF